MSRALVWCRCALSVVAGLVVANPTVARAAGADDCSGAIPEITALPFTDTGSTAGANADSQSLPVACYAWGTVSGADHVYQITAGPGAHWSIELDTTLGGWDAALYVLQVCDDTNTCLATADDVWGAGVEVLPDTPYGAGTYFIWVDTYYSLVNGQEGPYALTVDGVLGGAHCGDGLVNVAGETCDGDGAGVGGETASCDADCTAVACGDGVINTTAGEICDDGDAIDDGNGCAADCLTRTGSCGNGAVESYFEECDDSGVAPGDGCNAVCLVEGGSCAVPFDLNADGDLGDGTYQMTGDTSSSPPRYAAPPICGWGSSANPEMVAVFRAPADGDYLFWTFADWFEALWLWDATCAAAVDALVCDSGFASGPTVVSLPMTQNQIVYAVVDGYGDFTVNEGAFTLTVAPDACGDGVISLHEVCDDGTNDGSYGGCNSGCGSLAAFCGDSTTDSLDGEACDDGVNDGSYGGCLADCTDWGPYCGDGAIDVTFGESCDDSNGNDGDGCSAACLVEGGVCGDGVLNVGEICDDGIADGSYGGCAVDCLAFGPYCGDGITQAADGEDCDDGNTVDDGNGCTAACARVGSCGDDLLQPVFEDCDDGNTTDGDSCPATCFITGGSCRGPFDLNAAGDLGDGSYGWTADTNLFPSEYDAPLLCGSASAGPAEGVAKLVIPSDGTWFFQADGTFDAVLWLWDDACSPIAAPLGCVDDQADTDPESLELLLTAGQTVFIVVDGWGWDDTEQGTFDLIAAPLTCGDGIVAPSEVCDDGINDGGYGSCLSDCSAAAAYCGDGAIDNLDGEVCDDGTNDGSYNGCGVDCTTWGPYCGDGQTDSGDGEVCDDGTNDGSYNGCSPGCASQPARCGDGTLDVADGEVCDDGINDGSYGSCAADCSAFGPFCGDGTIDTADGESCDDGNATPGDGCSGACLIEGGSCGDGDLNVGEVCDDGVNDGGYDGCLADCSGRGPFCGDGTVDAGDGEECDDGNGTPGDGCAADCTDEGGTGGTGGTGGGVGGSGGDGGGGGGGGDAGDGGDGGSGGGPSGGCNCAAGEDPQRQPSGFALVLIGYLALAWRQLRRRR